MIPFNTFLILYLLIYLLSSVTELAIEKINAAYIKEHGGKVPLAFKGVIDKGELRKMNQYTLDNTHFTLVHRVVSMIVFLFIILSGVLPWLHKSLSDSNFVLAGLIFFAVPALLGATAGLPFDYYHSFVIEERYGFNTKTRRLWLSDLLKSLLLTSILGAILLSCLFLLVKHLGHTWWIWAWAMFFCFQLLMTILYPVLIAPLFNRFVPLEDPELARKIKALAEGEGVSIKGISQMDATKRSLHTNAYFSGLGKTKRIVLFDSLIQSLEVDEIVAVLAHEIGHLKKGHLKKQVAISSLVSIVLFFLASKMITWEGMFQGFGFSDMPLYVGLFLVGVLWQPAGFFLSPIVMAISRKFEREADMYATGISGMSAPFLRALKRMAKDNLSNLRPHPLYVWFNYSHPPLIDRIRRLKDHESLRS
jgi:STE24 endopeptidase